MKKSYKLGKLKVADGHALHFELFGNPKATPILYLHGGPGSGFSDRHKRFFDPKVHNVLFFDQRGSGRSTPFASLHENNTQKLVEDIIALLEFLKIKKVFIMGGSWGSTLGMAFALAHPQYVLGLILWGIYFGSSQDTEYCYQGKASSYLMPEAWERFMSIVPKNKRNNIASYYFKKILADKNDKHLYEWARYETSLLKLNMTEEEIEEDMKDDSYKSISPIEAHYISNNCFLENGYILKNAHKLSKFPVSIIHGKYDLLCSPANANKLHQKIGGSKLYFEIAGHSTRDEAIERRIIKEVGKLKLI